MIEQTLPKILIVDDEADNLAALTRLLRKNFEVVSFESAESAIEYLKNPTNLRLIDCVVSDQRMPGLSGFEFLEIVKSLDSVLTRILITGFSDLEAVTQAINRGEIWRYIAKPWEPQDLLFSLNQAVERTRTQRKLQQTLNENQKQIEELKAKEWSRHYLFKILLHEFRTAPQVLIGAQTLSQDPQVNKFLQSLIERFGILESEIKDYIEFEKSVTLQEKKETPLSEALTLLTFLTDKHKTNLQTTEHSSLKINVHKESFASGMHFLHQCLLKNTQKTIP